MCMMILFNKHADYAIYIYTYCMYVFIYVCIHKMFTYK